MTATAARHDVVIMGGGLAGLTLALQLKQTFADIDVVALERRNHPVPHAAHKVGESSVEIGAHYFDTVLGLGPHMRGAQLRKFGFRFFFSEGRRDIDAVTEIGASRYLFVPSYQIDRGIFENYLAEEAAHRGVQFIDGATVRRIDLAGDARSPHLIECACGGENRALHARWLVDACGRAGMLKRKLPVKVIWDYTYYWGVLSQIFFQQRLTDLALLGRLRSELLHCQRLNFAMQGFLRAWSAVSRRRNPPVLLDHAALPWFAELNRSLTDRLDDRAFVQRLKESTRRLDLLAAEVLDRATRDHPALDGGGLRAVQGERPTLVAGESPREPMLFAPA
ncbi:FAD binding domain-containing protein [Variovorax sp. HW608]|uniref:NAD(P)/FAD-dependent oxidoreductase n=1 Tax=Variovorax sp. HW608 TaxID=1034889 RepID=UPI00081FCF64|nr:FAD-dependent monooxygenase [Variovorax sp. HW608]SCK36535.1 FAD binding domain-containing protein [Variovorax sp. HW608]